MPTEVIMPQMGESIFEGTITKWLKKPGDTVERDEPLFEISTDKVDAEIPSPAAGILTEIKVAEGATVQINTVVALLGEAGSAAAAPAAVAPAAAPAPAASTAPPAKSAGPVVEAAPALVEAALAPTAAPSAAIDVIMPQMGESIFEGTITKWLKQPGDTVQRDEPLFEISTDKVDAEIPSPAAGVLSEIKVAAGATVQINTVVAVIGGAVASAMAASQPSTSGETEINTANPIPAAAQPAVAAAAAAQKGSIPDIGSSSTTDRIRSSPLVRRIAKDNDLDLRQVTGTGSAGRITKEDILGVLANPATAKAAPLKTASTTVAAPSTAVPASTPVASPKAAPTPVAATVPGDLVPLSRMRGIIAQRMIDSKRTSPHVHTCFKIDMTRVVKIREKEKSKYEQRNGVKLSFMPFLTRAVIVALRKMPIVNASMEGDAVRYHQNVNIGIAVALDWGLIVPVIKQAEDKSFLGVARAIADLAERARSKKLKPDEVSGGTFTITNSGIFGEEFGTPIINQPESAILGIGGLFKEPAVVTDENGSDAIAVRNIIRLTLGFDHRIVDGADAGKFMSEVKKYLETWSEEIG